MKELADRFSIATSTIRQRCGRDHWTRARKQARHRSEQATQRNEVMKRSTSYADWDERHMKAAEAINFATVTELAKIVALQRKRAEATEEQLKKLPHVSEVRLSRLAKTAQLVVEIERKVHGRDNLDDAEPLADFSSERAKRIMDWIELEYEQNGGIRLAGNEAKA